MPENGEQPAHTVSEDKNEHKIYETKEKKIALNLDQIKYSRRTCNDHIDTNEC